MNDIAETLELMVAAIQPAVSIAIHSPGIYRNLPAEIYHGLKLASNSHLGALKRSPAHCRFMMDEPNRATPAMVLGEAIHFAVFQPDIFGAQYAKLPDGDGRTAAVKAARAELASRYCEDRILSCADYETCVKVRDSVWSHPAAKKILSRAQPDDAEVSGVWDDEESGVRCKLRSDLLIGGRGIVADLKTTEDAGRDTFMRSVFRYGYYRQGAMYLDGWSKLDHPCEHFVLIAVEKQPPFCCAVYRLEDDVVLAGRDEIHDLLKIYGECERSNYWPGYQQEIQSITLPAFAWRELLRESV